MFPMSDDFIKRQRLIDAVAAMLWADGPVNGALADCDLEPTNAAYELAATAAVAVLLAHERGQTVARDSAKSVPVAQKKAVTHAKKNGRAPKVSRRKSIEKVACPTCGVMIAAYRVGKHKCAVPAAD